MSRKATTRSLEPGEHLVFTNTKGRPVELILQTEWGTTMRMTLAIGGRVDFALGQERGSLYLLESPENGKPLRLVPGGRKRVERDPHG